MKYYEAFIERGTFERGDLFKLAEAIAAFYGHRKYLPDIKKVIVHENDEEAILQETAFQRFCIHTQDKFNQLRREQ